MEATAHKGLMCTCRSLKIYKGRYCIFMNSAATPSGTAIWYHSCTVSVTDKTSYLKWCPRPPCTTPATELSIWFLLITKVEVHFKYRCVCMLTACQHVQKPKGFCAECMCVSVKSNAECVCACESMCVLQLLSSTGQPAVSLITQHPPGV